MIDIMYYITLILGAICMTVLVTGGIVFLVHPEEGKFIVYIGLGLFVLFCLLGIITLLRTLRY